STTTLIFPWRGGPASRSATRSTVRSAITKLWATAWLSATTVIPAIRLSATTRSGLLRVPRRRTDVYGRDRPGKFWLRRRWRFQRSHGDLGRDCCPSSAGCGCIIVFVALSGRRSRKRTTTASDRNSHGDRDADANGNRDGDGNNDGDRKPHSRYVRFAGGSRGS